MISDVIKMETLHKPNNLSMLSRCSLYFPPRCLVTSERFCISHLTHSFMNHKNNSEQTCEGPQLLHWSHMGCRSELHALSHWLQQMEIRLEHRAACWSDMQQTPWLRGSFLLTCSYKIRIEPSITESLEKYC